MTEVEGKIEKGSDLHNQEKMQTEGIDPDVVSYAVDAEDAENEAEEERLGRAGASDTDIPELGEDHPIPDKAPPPDEIHSEYDPLPPTTTGFKF